MGLYDRDYYRNDTRRWDAWQASRGTVGLILLFVGLFTVQLLNRPPRFGPDALMVHGVFDLDAVLHGQLWRIFTAPLLHNSWSLWPILVGMVALFWFGRGVEGIHGTREFLLFFGAAILVTQAGEFLARYSGLEDSKGHSYGPMGPIAAVLVAFACHYPRETVNVFFFLPVPVWLVAIGFVLLSLMGLVDGHGSPALPLCGAAFGYLYHAGGYRLSGWLPAATAAPARRVRPVLRVVPGPDRDDDPSDAETERRGPPVDEQFEAKVDHVLEKVARVGRASLSAAEQELLLKASELYKKRRGG